MPVGAGDGLLTKEPKAALELLWGEYKYRHDLCWRVVLQLTAAAVILASLPYANVTVTKTLGAWILPVPLIGIVLTVFGWFVLETELSLLARIRDQYRQVQTAELGVGHKAPSGFKVRVLIYLALLLVLQLLNLLVVVRKWVPRVHDLAG